MPPDSSPAPHVDLAVQPLQPRCRRRLANRVTDHGAPVADSGDAGPEVAAGVAALLLGPATTAGSPDPGFALKCLNSALKALDLADRSDAPADVRRLVTELRTHALGLVDRIGTHS
jgi:hypothetical protein